MDLDITSTTGLLPSHVSGVALTGKQRICDHREVPKDLAYGSVAGMLGKVFEHPFDTVKLTLQSQPCNLPLRYDGAIDCFRRTVRQNGFASLYRGLSVPLIGAAAETACLFTSYKISQDAVRMLKAPSSLSTDNKKMSLDLLVVAGAMSGATTSLILTPIELIKCRVQVSLACHAPTDATSERPRSGPLAIVRDVYRERGLAGFWRGQFGTLLRETGGTASWFGCFEAYSAYSRQRIETTTGIKDPDLSVSQIMTAGAVAGAGYNLSFYPADTIKTRMQTDLLLTSGTTKHRSFAVVAFAIYQEHGIRGFYKGCSITLLKSAPASALIFTVTEHLRVLFG